MDFYGWRPYVSVAERRRKAAKEMAKLKKKGHPVSPVVVEGRTIVKTFWGKAWCENLEQYSDFANRLAARPHVCPQRFRDRSADRAGRDHSPGQRFVDLQGGGESRAVAKARWQSICTDCAGAIDSLIELLQGRFSKGVMERVCRQKTGLFPSPHEIKLSCSCPDWAGMCKHVAAVLYGIGARLDQQPELLFRLHSLDEKELIAGAGKALPQAKRAPAAGKVLGGEDLAALFGLDMAQGTEPGASEPKRAKAKAGKEGPGSAGQEGQGSRAGQCRQAAETDRQQRRP